MTEFGFGIGLFDRVSMDLVWLLRASNQMAQATNSDTVTLEHALAAALTVNTTIGRRVRDETRITRSSAVAFLSHENSPSWVGKPSVADAVRAAGGELKKSSQRKTAGSVAWFAHLLIESSWNDAAILRHFQVPDCIIVESILRRCDPTGEQPYNEEIHAAIPEFFE